jgi:hypothetical protein
MHTKGYCSIETVVMTSYFFSNRSDIFKIVYLICFEIKYLVGRIILNPSVALKHHYAAVKTCCSKTLFCGSKKVEHEWIVAYICRMIIEVEEWTFCTECSLSSSNM